jgi:hypothetical protein
MPSGPNNKDPVRSGVRVLYHQPVVDSVSRLASFGQQGGDLAEIGRPGGPQDEPFGQRLIHLARVPVAEPTVDRASDERRIVEPVHLIGAPAITSGPSAREVSVSACLTSLVPICVDLCSTGRTSAARNYGPST